MWLLDNFASCHMDGYDPGIKEKQTYDREAKYVSQKIERQNMPTLVG